MTFTQFRGLDDESKELVFRNNGVMVSERKEEYYHYRLYQAFGFYIEIRFGILTNNSSEFIAFENTALLEPYLEQLDINFIF